MIFNEDAWNTVWRGRNEESIIESNFERSRLDFSIPVNPAIAQTKVPLSDYTRSVPSFLQQSRDGELIRFDDQGGVAGEDARSGFSPGVLAGKKSVARGSASGRRCMRVRESKSTACNRVQVWRFHCGRAITADISITHIIRVDEDDVGQALRNLLSTRRSGQTTGTNVPKKLSTIHEYSSESSAIMLTLFPYDHVRR